MVDEPAAKPAPERPAYLVGSLLKAHSLLSRFSSRRRELSTAWLSQESGYPRPTVHRIMTTLMEIGWVVRTPTGSWALGPSLFRLGSLAGDAFDLRSSVRPYLAELARRTGDSSYLFVPLGERVLCLDRILGPGSVKVSMVDVGQTLPITRGAAPLVLLAYGDGNGNGAGVDPALARELEKIRAQGYALNIEVLAKGVCAVSAPLFDQTGEVVAAISLGGLRERFSDERLPDIAQDLLDTARRISMSLGYGGDWPWSDDAQAPAGT